MLGVDPRRFGDYATKSYLRVKNEEAYSNVFVIHFPDEERPAGRPLRTAPCYDRLKALGAVFGQKFGWERANWFAPEGVAQEDDWSFRRSKWFEHAVNESRNVAENVGLLDMTAFAKCRISGPGALDFLDHLLANRVPKKIGRVGLCHALNTRGGVHSEFTVMREAEDSYYLVSAGAYQRLDHDWIKKHMPDDGSVQFQNLTNSIGVLVVAGPKARELMQRVSTADFSNEAFPWLMSHRIDVGLAPTVAARVNFVGELGWELHHPIEYQNQIFDALMEAGRDLGLKPFGIRAMDMLRMEKSYRMVGTELSIEYAAFESGLQRFVHPNKGDFIGREGNNPLFKDGEMVGRATSGNYGPRLDKSFALAMVPPELAAEGTELEMDVLGTEHRVTVVGESPFDPENERLRA
jgi:dimethylglycine dehydrogenase